MAERLAYLEAVIGADITQFRKAMRDVRNDVGILSETIGGIGKAARTATFAVSAPLATLGTYAVQAASDFDGAMRNINSIAGMSESQLQDLSKQVLEFGKTTRGGATESANALYTVFSAGLTDTALAMNTMQVATKTAEAGLADMETTTEALVASMLSYGVESMTAERASDALTAMVQVGVGSMQNFANSVANALPAAASLGVEIEDLYGAMAFMTQRGFSAAKASTSLNSAMTALVKPTEAMQTAMQRLGVKGAEELIGKYGTLGGAIKALVNTTDGSGEAIAELFSNVRGKRFVDLLAKDFESFEGSMEEFNTLVDGATDRAYAEQMKSFAAQWDLMTSAVEGAAIAIGQVLLPVVTPVINAITDIFNNISNLNPQLLQLGVAFGGLLVVVPPLVWLFTTLLNPIGLLVSAVATLGGLLVSNFGSVSEVFTSFVNTMKAEVPALGSILGTIQEVVNDFVIKPPSVDEIVPSEPVKVPANRLVEVKAGDTVWDIWNLDYKDKGWTQEEFYAEFKRLNGQDNFTIYAGDFITLPPYEIGGEAAKSITATDKIFYEEIEKQEKIKLDLAQLIDINDPQGSALAISDRLGIMFKTIAPQIKPAIAGAINSIKIWFDEQAGNGINWVAGLFDETEYEGGKSPVYNAITSLFEGDFVGALNALVPKLGDNVAKFLQDIFGVGEGTAFPNITAALSNLATNIGDWLLNEGIPTISRSIGFFAGKVAVLIYDGLKMVGDWLASGGMQKAAGDAGDVAQKAVIDPLVGGFEDAVGGTEFESATLNLLGEVETALGDALQGISDALIVFEAAWNAVNVPQLIGSVEDFGSKIGTAIENLTSADWSGVALILGTLAAGVSWIFNTIASGTIDGLGDILIGVTGAIGNFATAISNAVKGDTEGFFRELGHGLLDLGFAVIAFPVAVIDAIIEGIGNLLGIDVGSIGEFMENLKNSIKKGMTAPTPIKIQGNSQIAWEVDAGAVEDSVYSEYIKVLDDLGVVDLSDVGNTPTVIGFELDEDLTKEELSKALDGIVKLLDDPAVFNSTLGGALLNLIADLEDSGAGNGFDWDTWFDEVFYGTTPSDTPTPEVPVEPVIAFDGWQGGMVEEVNKAVETEAANNPTNPVAYDEAAIAEAGTAAGQLGVETAVAAYKSGATVDEFKTTFLVPFSEAWVETFGEEGAARKASIGFATTFGTSMAGMTVAALGMAATTSVVLGTFTTVFTGKMQNVATSADKAAGQVRKLRDEIAAIAAISTDLKIKVEVTGQIGALPSHAQGLDYVPRDGYVAELHKGEMVLPAAVANQLRSASSVTGEATRAQTVNNTTSNNSQNTIIINGAQDVDGIINELERRGIYL